MAKKNKKEDDLFGSIPPPEEFNAFPTMAFPDDIISALTKSEQEVETPNSNTKKTRQRDTPNSATKQRSQMALPNDNVNQRNQMVMSNGNAKQHSHLSMSNGDVKRDDQLAQPNDNTKQREVMTSPNDTTKRHGNMTPQDDVTNCPDNNDNKTFKNHNFSTNYLKKMTSQNDVTDRHNDMTLQNGHTNYHSQTATPNGNTKWQSQTVTSNSITKSNQISLLNDATERRDQVAWRINTPPLLKTKNQKNLFNYLSRTGSVITTIGNIAKETGIPARTVQRILTLFEDVGYISKEKYVAGDIQGIKIIVLDRMRNDVTNCRDQLTPPDGNVNWQGQNASKIDRIEEKSIYLKEKDSNDPEEQKLLDLTEDDLKFFFPNLSATGFGTSQIKQIVQTLKKIGRDCKKIIRSLEHAEWELANNCMLDKNGEPVKDPCSYVFLSLAREGYYRRPKGYISPEEQAIKDEQEEMERKLKALKQKEEIEFQVWKESLSKEELEKILKNKKGPKEQWLRYIWKQKKTE